MSRSPLTASALDDPTLGEELTAKSAKDDARVKVTFALGNITTCEKSTSTVSYRRHCRERLRSRAVNRLLPRRSSRLATGFKRRSRTKATLSRRSTRRSLTRFQADRVLDVSFHVVTGAKVNIGEIRIRGLKRMRESFVRRRLLVHTGERYGASKIERARKDLLALGVFTSVTVELGATANAAGEVPITFRVRERLLHAVSLSAAYSTDLGGSSGVTWTDRDMTGKADQLTLGASVLNLGGTASTGVGYDLTAKYLLPEFGHRDQSLQLAVQAINQSLQAYDQKALTFGATLTRKLSNIWTVNVGVTAEVESIGQEGYYQEPCPSATAADCPNPTFPPTWSSPTQRVPRQAFARGRSSPRTR